VCAAIERDVRDGVVAGGEEVVRREILLHPGEKLGGFPQSSLARVHLKFPLRNI
jgi:hypothetical protein